MAKLTPADRAEIIRLLRDGIPRNEVARRTGRGQATVTRIANAEGITLDRSATKAAVEARMAQLKSDLADDAARLRQQLFAPCVEQKAMTVALGRGQGSTVEIVEIHRDQPTFSEQARIMTAVGIAVDKVHAIDDHSRSDDDLSDVQAFTDWLLGDEPDEPA